VLVWCVYDFGLVLYVDMFYDDGFCASAIVEFCGFGVFMFLVVLSV